MNESVQTQTTMEDVETSEPGVEDVSNITSLDILSSVLRRIGIETSAGEGSAITGKIKVDDKDHGVVFSIDTKEDGLEWLRIDCQQCVIGDITKNEEAFGGIILDFFRLNNEIDPFALGMIDINDPNDMSDNILNLTESMPIGDLSEGEISAAIGRLRGAVMAVSSTVDDWSKIV